MKTTTPSVSTAAKTATWLCKAALARFAALAFAVIAAGTVLAAPTATVVWESDFGTATKIGTDGNSYTITLNGNTVNTDGNLVINNSANSNLGATIDISSSPTIVSVLIRYSSLSTKTTSRTLATFKCGSYTFGAQTIGDNTREMRIYENSANTGRYWTPTTKPTLVNGSGYLLMTYDRSSGTYAYTGSSVSAMTGAGSESVKYSLATVSQVSVGGPCAVSTGTYAYAWDGVVIEKVAIFVGSTPTTSEIAEYVFPGDEALKSAVSEALDAGLDVAAWREASESTFHTSKTGTVNSDGSVSPSADLIYDNYGRTAAIGPVLVYDKAGYVASSDAQFYPFALGGLYVNALGASDATYTVTGTGDRPTRLGYTGYDTYFTFNQPFAFNREGNVTIYGTATVTTATGVTFDCNSAKTSNTTILDSGATLKLAGEGNMSVTTLNALNGTLDFSALSSRTAALPYITGTVQLGANTGIVLPAGTTSPYKIGTATDGTFPSEITIGETTYKATVSAGENAGEIAWTVNSYDINSAGTLALEDMFSSTSEAGGYEINVNESATLNIASATTVGSLAINIASGKTLTITGSALTVSNGITVNGASGFVKMTSSLLLGMFAGDATIIYSGAVPTSTSSGRNANFTSSDWTGVVWVENITSSTSTALRISDWTSANSKVKLTNVLGHMPGKNNSDRWQLDYNGDTLGELVLENTDSSGVARSYGFCKHDGWSKDARVDSYCKFAKLSGSGTLTETDGKTQTPCFIFEDGSEFTGVIEATQGMGIVFGTSSSSFASKRISVDADEEVTIPAGNTWTASSGFYVSGTLNANGISASAITVNDGGVLNVASTASLTGAISGAGTVVGNQCFPVPGSSFTGTLSVTGGATPNSPVESAATAVYGSVLNVAGSVYLTGNVTTLPETINIASGAYLMFGNASMTSLTITPGTWDGMLYIGNACTSLATLTINAGTERTLSSAKFALGSDATLATVNIVLDEIKGEGGTIALTSTIGLTAVEGRTYNFTVNCLDGRTVAGTYDGATSTITYTPSISGAATDIDWDFTDGDGSTFEQAPEDASVGYGSTLTYYTDPDDTTKTGVYIKHYPYVNGAASFFGSNSAAMSVAVVGTMPATSNTIFLNVGSAYPNQYGLVFLTTETPNEVLIGYNYGGTVTPITPMTVPNAATARHSYIITKEDGDSTTTFTIYLDGIKWKTVTTASKIAFASTNSGVQVGSDFGGSIYSARIYSQATDDVGVLNVLRVYGRIVTEAEIAVYADTFPYVSPNGSSSRTFATAAEDWVEATGADWTNTDSEGTVTSGSAPAAGASVTVTASAATEITVNLDSDTQYEAFAINGSATTLAKGTNSGKISVTGMTVIGAPVTVESGAADFTGGPMTITEDGSIAFDYSAYDISGIYTTTDIPLTSDVDRNDSKVTLIAPSAAYRTATLVYTSGHYAMRVTPDHENGAEVYFKSGYLKGNMAVSGSGEVYVDSSFTTQTALFPDDTMVVNDSSTLWQNQLFMDTSFAGNIRFSRTTAATLRNGEIAGTFLDGRTITVDEGCALTIAPHSSGSYALILGSVTANGAGTVSLSDSLSIAGAVSGTAPVTISGTVSVSAGGSIANTLSGSGTLSFAQFPASALSLGTWTGTVSLPAWTSGSSGLNLNNFGKAGSTVRLAGVSGGAWLANAEIQPVVELAGAFTLNAFSATFANTIDTLSGSGAFSLLADGTANDYRDGYFLVKNASAFTGSIALVKPGLALGGTSKPSSTNWYGKIVLQASATAGDGATWSAAGVVLADAAATLTVPSGATVPAVESGVSGYSVWIETSDSGTVYSLVSASDATGIAVVSGSDTFTIPRGWAAANGCSTAAALSETGANGIPAWQSYYLGLDPQDATSVLLCTAAGDAASAASEGSVTVEIANLSVPSAATDVAVVCRLQTWNGTAWEDCGEPVAATAGQPVSFTVSVPSSGILRCRAIATISKNE